MFTKKQNLVVNTENNEVTIFPQTINFKWFEEVSPFIAHNIWQLEKTACLQNSVTYQLATLIPTFFFLPIFTFLRSKFVETLFIFSDKKPMYLENKLSLAKEANEILLSTHKLNLKEHTILWDNKTWQKLANP